MSEELSRLFSQLPVDPFRDSPLLMLVFLRDADDLVLCMYRPDMGRGRGVATSESGEDADFSGSAGAGGAGAGAGFLGVCFGGWVRQTDTQIKET